MSKAITSFQISDLLHFIDVLREGSQDFQVWYDDPQSLAIKYQVETLTQRNATVYLNIGGKTFGAERSGILDCKLFGLFKHFHGGRDVGRYTNLNLFFDIQDFSDHSNISMVDEMWDAIPI